MYSRLGLIGDVHAEHHALLAALTHLRVIGVDAILCVGDIVDGPGDLEACVRLLDVPDVISVRGNHERWLLENRLRTLPDAHFIESLSEHAKQFFSSLPLTRRLQTAAGPLLLCHGLGDDDMGQVRPSDSSWDLSDNRSLQRLLEQDDLSLVVNGHSHVSMVRSLEPITLINAGTLSRESEPCFAFVDLVAKQVRFFELDEHQQIDERERYQFGMPGQGLWGAL
ncbi:MAG: metallophosphoesterase family protein [Polyangiaceae bacterium]